MFDNTEFGISSRDARALAPSTRKLLEMCFLALLDSGIDYRARNVGCYTSGTSFDITTVTEPVSRPSSMLSEVRDVTVSRMIRISRTNLNRVDLLRDTHP